MAARGEAGIGEFLDGLSPRTVGVLAEAGFEMGLLRHLGRTDEGARQVRHIVGQFGRVPWWHRAAHRIRRGFGALAADAGTPAGTGRVAAYWSAALLCAILGLAATLTASVLVARVLGLAVAGAVWIVLVVLLLMAPGTRGREAAVLLALGASAVLLFTAFLNAPQWYLAARGRQVTATVVAPLRSWSHGSPVTYCRVRLPGGAVRRVDRNDRTCASEEGRSVAVVYDPGGRLDPVLGDRASLGRISRPIAAGAGFVLFGTATGAVLATGRRGRGR
ncbi:hypothetical protein ABZ901_28505 [Actinacidiphila alni]|uniref:hypothetical protein n=1 Tax=Actinacidiphila alni TaxID=380248 RepID=UPI0033FC9412